MDIPLVLEKLGLAGEDAGPGATSSSTYAQLAAGWRGRVPVPTQAVMEAKWAEVQAALPATATELARARAKSLFDGTSEGGVKDRAIALTLVDTLNVLRSWLRDFKTAVAGAATLAALKTAVAALPNLPDIQPSEARNAVRAKLDSGAVDAPPP